MECVRSVAQLVEQASYTRPVVGSSPTGPTEEKENFGRLAQLVRASRLHREGRRFESCIAHHTKLGFVECVEKNELF